MNDTKPNVNTLATVMCRQREDRNNRVYFFAGGSKEPQMVDLSKVVFFLYPFNKDDGTEVIKLAICEGHGQKNDSANVQG